MLHFNLPVFAPGRPATDVDAALRRSLAACEEARRCAVLWFAEVQRRELWRAFGHASLELYAVHRLGFSRNRYWQFKRLADDLDRLPVLEEAVTEGRLGWTKAQQVARVATPATESSWVERAEQTGRRELAAAVTAEVARVKGVARKAASRAEACAATLAIPATIALRADAPPAQVIVHQCPDCAAASVTTAAGERPLAPAQLAAVACDARVSEPGRPNRATIPPRTRRAVLARGRHRCATPGCGATAFLEVHHLTPRSRGGSNRAANLVTLCGRCHAFAHEGGVAPAQLATAHLGKASAAAP